MAVESNKIGFRDISVAQTCQKLPFIQKTPKITNFSGSLPQNFQLQWFFFLFDNVCMVSYLYFLESTIKGCLFKKNEKDDDILAGEALRINHLTKQHSIHSRWFTPDMTPAKISSSFPFFLNKYSLVDCARFIFRWKINLYATRHILKSKVVASSV